jgi:O-antigen/teichoic acid export membrane protein
VPVRLQSLFKITGSLAFPKYAEREASDILPGMPRKMFLFALVILAACAFYILVAPLLFSIFFPKYVESIPYSQILVFFTLSAVTYPFSAYLTAHKKISANYLYGVATLGLKMGTLLLFVPRWGVWGAVLSMLVSTAGILIITAILFVRERRMAAR